MSLRLEKNLSEKCPFSMLLHILPTSGSNPQLTRSQGQTCVVAPECSGPAQLEQ